MHSCDGISGESDDEYIKIQKAADYVKKRIEEGAVDNPVVGIICGSGLANLAASMTDSICIAYEQIPNFPISTVVGHSSSMMIGKLNGVPTICLLGRFHFYEGHPIKMVIRPVRLLKLLGVTTLLITNSAGGLQDEMRVGDIMVIEDHISFPSLSGINPLMGPNNAEFGPRFPAMTNAYHPKSYEIIKSTATNAGLPAEKIKRGVYTNVGGPSYETPAELRFLKLIGAGAVGMSTASEVIAASHCGINVLAFSLITNLGISNSVNNQVQVEEPCHEEVLAASEQQASNLKALVLGLAPLMLNLK